MRYLAFDRYDEDARARLSRQFAEARPFPHLVLDDMIVADQDEVMGGFPALDWGGWTVLTDAYQKGKRFCSEMEQIPPVPKAILQELNEPAFLRFVETITGTEQLLVDPYLEGAGLHCTGPGGRLSAHIDFHYYKALSVYRRLNVLLYLNPSWQDTDGGQLQLFQKGTTDPEVSVTPRYGRCVIFRTDDQSLHGVAPVTGTTEPRRSLAVYYYTSTESEVFSGGTATYWRTDGSAGMAPGDRVRTLATKGFVRASRVFAKAAHLTDPNVAKG